MIIDQLESLNGSPQSSDELLIERGIRSYKIDYDSLKGAITDNLATKDEIAECKVYVHTIFGVSQLPRTSNASRDIRGYVCINAILSNPSAQTSNWTVTTGANGKYSITIGSDGETINGSTDITLYLMKPV